MHKVRNERTPQIFRTVYSVTNNKYNRRSCRGLTFSKTQYNIYFRGPYLWNSMIATELKDLTFPLFKSKIKTLCFCTTNTVLVKCTYREPYIYNYHNCLFIS